MRSVKKGVFKADECENQSKLPTQTIPPPKIQPSLQMSLLGTYYKVTTHHYIGEAYREGRAVPHIRNYRHIR